MLATAGTDGAVDLGLAPDGAVMLTWLEQSADGLFHLRASAWTGAGWTAAQELLAAEGLSSPELGQLGGHNAIFWTQDVNPDPEVTQENLFYSVFDGAWSAPLLFSPVLLNGGSLDAQADPAAADVPMTPQGFFFIPEIWDDCCDCDPGDPD